MSLFQRGGICGVSTSPVNEGYQQDVEKAVRAAKKWQKEIPELTDHSPKNAIDILAALLLQCRDGQCSADEAVSMRKKRAKK